MEEEGEGKGRRSGLTVFSQEYYAVCAFGGMLSAGTTHLAITPLDVLKVNMQVNPVKYNGIFSGLHILVKEQGPSSLWRGWSGKLFGYGVQGGCKFGLYEYFKKMYTDLMIPHNQTMIFFISSASAQILADIALCPFEAVKVRVQTQPHFARGLVMACQNCVPMKAFLASTRGLVHFGLEIFHTVRFIGFPRLFTRSLPIRIALVGPVVTLQWFLYDSIKLLTGLPTSGGIITDRD